MQYNSRLIGWGFYCKIEIERDQMAYISFSKNLNHTQSYLL